MMGVALGKETLHGTVVGGPFLLSGLPDLLCVVGLGQCTPQWLLHGWSSFGDFALTEYLLRWCSGVRWIV